MAAKLSFWIIRVISVTVVLDSFVQFGHSMHIGPGTITSNEIWEFVTKFAFNYAPQAGTIIGKISGTIRVDSDAFLVIYDDQDFSWSHIYNNDTLTCDYALLPRAKGGPLVNKYKLMPHKVNAIDIKITEHLRPRLWYFAIVTAKCNSVNKAKNGKKAMDLHNLHWLDDGEKNGDLKLGKVFIDLNLINTRQGYQEHFSFDEEGMLPMTVLFLIVYFVGFVSQCYFQTKFSDNKVPSIVDGRITTTSERARKLTTNSSSSGNGQAFPLVKLWGILVLLELASLVFRTVDLLIYSKDGEEATRWRWSRLLTLQIFGWATDIASQLGLALMVMLIAKGWTITANEIRGRGQLMCFLVVVMVATCLMYGWAAVDWDPASTLYIYESVPGTVVLVLRLAMFFWFIRSLIETFRLEASLERRSLYKTVAVIYSLWFLSLPLIVVGAYMLSPWYRAKVVSALVYSVHTIALSVFGVLFWPSRAKRYFNIKQSINADAEEGKSLLRGGYDDDEL